MIDDLAARLRELSLLELPPPPVWLEAVQAMREAAARLRAAPADATAEEEAERIAHEHCDPEAMRPTHPRPLSRNIASALARVAARTREAERERAAKMLEFIHFHHGCDDDCIKNWHVAIRAEAGRG